MGATDDLGFLIDREKASADVAVAFSQGAFTAELIGFADEVPLLLIGDSATAIAARTTVDLHGEDIGHEVVVILDRADPRRPIVIGRIRGDRASRTHVAGDANAVSTVEIESDGRRVLLRAAEQLVLRCGQASITLTRAGKVLVQGTYVSSRSSGVNRIKGGSIQLN